VVTHGLYFRCRVALDLGFVRHGDVRHMG
jgi:hypothetical protein